jgi:hypothetical protein
MPEPTPSSRETRWARWVRFLAHRETGEALALFRIACGLCVLGAVGSVVLDGLAPVLWLNRADGGYRDFPDPPWLFHLLGGLTPTTLQVVVAVALVCGLMLVAGLGARLTPLLALQAWLALTEINPQTGGSDDLLLANALWLLVLSRSTATLSLDCRLRTGKWVGNESVPAWPRYLAIYQLVLTYGATGAQKLGFHWTPGGDFSALYYILQIPSWQRGEMTWLAWVYPLTQAATAVTWLWETSAPLLLLSFWYRNTADRPGWLRALFNRLGFRRIFVLVGLCMHGGLMLLMNVEPFNWVTLSYYVCLFRPEEWRAAWRRLCGWGRQGGEGVIESHPKKPSPEAPWIAQARAVLVAGHLLAVTLMAIPGPGGYALDRANWEAPDAQENLAAWSEQLARWGVALSKQQFEDRLWSLVVVWGEARRRVLAAFEPYYDYCGTYQSWRMFGTATRAPTRLHIEVMEGARWRPVYVEREPRCDWLGRWLDHSRFRPALFRFGLRQDEDAFPGFASWVARQAARDFPAASAVRVRFRQAATLPPAEVRAGRRPRGSFHSTRVLRLDAYR